MFETTTQKWLEITMFHSFWTNVGFQVIFFEEPHADFGKKWDEIDPAINNRDHLSYSSYLTTILNERSCDGFCIYILWAI